jgi:hypothetical protein
MVYVSVGQSRADTRAFFLERLRHTGSLAPTAVMASASDDSAGLQSHQSRAFPSHRKSGALAADWLKRVTSTERKSGEEKRGGF